MDFPKAVIPKKIRKEAEIALSHYPELVDVPIHFKFNDLEGKSFMLAQPVFKTLPKQRQDRTYHILIRNEFRVEDQVFTIDEIPEEVLIGWLGHELGHIMDYLERGKFNMIWFGLRYLYSEKYLKKAERAADTYAVQHGMADYIIKTKNFILNHSSLSQNYKDRINRLYLSPKEITDIVNKLAENEENLDIEKVRD